MDGGLGMRSDNERGFRPRQKGIDCSVDGCTEGCVSNDLCPKHSMQKLRRSNKKYRDYITNYNKRYKHDDVDKVCELCKKDFVTARKNQYLCSNCSGSNKGKYETQKKYRTVNAKKVRARCIVNKRIQRGVSLFKQPCEVCNKKENSQAHHHDYDKPLDITWLCEYHHNLIPDF